VEPRPAGRSGRRGPETHATKVGQRSQAILSAGQGIKQDKSDTGIGQPLFDIGHPANQAGQGRIALAKAGT
jgi:hypothetical protein